MLGAEIHLYISISKSVIITVRSRLRLGVNRFPLHVRSLFQLLRQPCGFTLPVNSPTVIAAGLQTDHLSGMRLKLMRSVYSIDRIGQPRHKGSQLLLPDPVIPFQPSVFAADQPVLHLIGVQNLFAAVRQFIGYRAPGHSAQLPAVLFQLFLTDGRRFILIISGAPAEAESGHGNAYRLLHRLHNTVFVHHSTFRRLYHEKFPVLVSDPGALRFFHVLLLHLRPFHHSLTQFLFGIFSPESHGALSMQVQRGQIIPEGLLFQPVRYNSRLFQFIIYCRSLQDLLFSFPEQNLQRIVLCYSSLRLFRRHARNVHAVDSRAFQETTLTVPVVYKTEANQSKQQPQHNHDTKISEDSFVVHSFHSFI